MRRGVARAAGGKEQTPKGTADFRKDNGPAIRNVCGELVALCRWLDPFSQAIVAINGSKSKAVNHRDKTAHQRQDAAAHGAHAARSIMLDLPEHAVAPIQLCTGRGLHISS